MEAEYDNSNDGLDDMYPSTTNNDFGLDPTPATPNTHRNDDIVDDNNNYIHNDNVIIVDNEYYPNNDKIHEDDDDDTQLYPQLDTTNDQLHPAPLPDALFKDDNICRSTHVCTKPQQLIPSLDIQKPMIAPPKKQLCNRNMLILLALMTTWTLTAH